MKRLLPFLLTLPLFISCKKNARVSNVAQTDTSYMMASISEYSGIWKPQNQSIGIDPKDSLLIIYGCTGYTDGSVGISHCVSLIIKNYLGPGTYNMPDINKSVYSHAVKGYNTEHKIVGGSITISFDDKDSINGSFEFNAYHDPIVDTVAVKNGNFHILKAK